MTMNRLGRALLVVLGTVILSVVTKLFLLPANLMGAGATGLSLVIEHYFGIPMPVVSLIFNVAMLAVAWVLLGRKFVMTTAFCSIVYPILLGVLDHVLGDIHVTDDQILNVLFAGAGVGLSIGLVVRGGGSTGGTDPLLLILEKYFRIPVTATVWVTDVSILLAQATFHPFEDLLYGVALIIVMTITLDKALLMGTSKTEVKIISERPTEIRDAIIHRVDRGVTMLHAEGGYLHQQTDVVLTVISTKELIKIERVAREVDPGCFVIVNRVSEVWGRGFTTAKK